LNTNYRNKNTLGYAVVWDKIYTLIRSFFGNTNSCQEAANIINSVGGTQSFELMRLAAEKRHKRTSNRLLELSAKGEHQLQQPEFIEQHSKRTGNCLLDLSAKCEHQWQQPEFIDQHS
jgi:hypothetical protein